MPAGSSLRVGAAVLPGGSADMVAAEYRLMLCLDGLLVNDALHFGIRSNLLAAAVALMPRLAGSMGRCAILMQVS